MDPTETGPEPVQAKRGSAASTLTVIMPAYNCCGMIARSLTPLLTMKEHGEIAEIIVVDDGSSDGTAAAARKLGARVLTTGGRSGPGAARNIGAREAKGEILWFVDSDVVVKDGAVHCIARALVDNTYVAVFGSYDDAPPAPNFLSQYKNLVHHHYHQIGRGDAATFWAGCGAVRKEAFVSVGGFDASRYPRPSIEDIELGYRLRAAGGRIRLDPSLQGTHLKMWKLRGLLTTEIRDRALPWSRLLLARGQGGNELNIVMTERIRALIACILVLAVLASLAGLTSWWLPTALLAIAFAANLELLALFRRRKGALFAVGGVLFHQLYYLYSTAVYSWCWALMRARPLMPARLQERLRLE
jgi:glycosyltransferase involved in cell wall biosynthesis